MSIRRDQYLTVDQLRARLQRDIADAFQPNDDIGLMLEALMLEADALAQFLLAEAPARDDAGLARAAMAALQPEMSRRAAADLRRRVLRRVLPALLPLPFVIAYAGYLLRALYLAIAQILSPNVAGYIASVHVLLLTLLFGATYAAIPMMLARSAPGRGVAGPLRLA